MSNATKFRPGRKGIRRGDRGANRAALGATLLAAILAGAACSGKSASPTSTKTDTTSSAISPKITPNPCAPSGTVTLAPAASALFDCSTGGTTLTLTGAGASYAVLTQFASDVGNPTFVNYRVRQGTSTATAAAVLARRPSPGSGLLMADGSGMQLKRNPLQEQADRVMLSRARQRAARVSALATAGSGRMQALRSAAVQSVPAVGSVRAFHVASSFTTNTYATVGAKLAFAGANLLLYVDTLAPTNGFTAAQLQAFGTLFDQTLYPLDTAAFGSPSDIDNNGHFIMVMSPMVNSLSPRATCSTQGYVAGFFDSTDFDSTDPNSNNGEVFYTIVPDPSAVASCTHTVATVGLDVPPTFLHELEHLINFTQHSVLRSGAPLQSGLDEGLAIVGEELGSLYYENKCPPPACRTSATQMFPDSSQGYVSSFLYDSYQYALLPDTAGMMIGDDSTNGFSWRGGVWLFVRYLVDQFGMKVLRALETGPAGAVAAVTAATGQPFPSTFANFGLALYTDSLPGLPRSTVPASQRFVTRNLRSLWSRLYSTSGSSSVPLSMPLVLAPITTDSSTLIMYPGTMSYWRLDTPASTPTVTIQFATPLNGPLAATLHPQFFVFRLPAGQ